MPNASHSACVNVCLEDNAPSSAAFANALPSAGRTAPTFRHRKPDALMLSSAVPHGARARCLWSRDVAAGAVVGRLDCEVRWPGGNAPKNPMSLKPGDAGRTRLLCALICPTRRRVSMLLCVDRCDASARQAVVVPAQIGARGARASAVREHLLFGPQVKFPPVTSFSRNAACWCALTGQNNFSRS